MVERRKKRRSGRYGSKRTIKKAVYGWFFSIFLIFFVVIAFVFVSYLGYLDYNVRKQFEGKRWAIPARVYANPVELYATFGN